MKRDFNIFKYIKTVLNLIYLNISKIKHLFDKWVIKSNKCSYSLKMRLNALNFDFYFLMVYFII